MKTSKLLPGCLLLIAFAMIGCTSNQPAPTPPQIIAPTVHTTAGSNVKPPDPIASTSIVQWENESGYYFSSHSVSTGASGLYSNPYAVEIVFNGGPLLR